MTQQCVGTMYVNQIPIQFGFLRWNYYLYIFMIWSIILQIIRKW
jgi:hypothetical protein